MLESFNECKRGRGKGDTSRGYLKLVDNKETKSIKHTESTDTRSY